MTKYVLDQYTGPEIDYPTLGFRADTGDILSATGAPDARWSVNANQAAAETVTRYTIGGDSSYIEPTDGHVLTWSDDDNAYMPTAPSMLLGTAQAPWVAAQAVGTSVVRQAPDGSWIKSTANRTTRATFDATEQTFWDTVSETVGTLEQVRFSAAYGIRAGDPARAIDANTYVKLQSSHDNAAGMVIWTQKVAGDSTDINIDGSVAVKHGKQYVATLGYADTLQVYTLAGSAGTIIGNNSFVEMGAPPYTIPATWTSNGFVRFELGPKWPESERMRLNNRGDLIIGWAGGAGAYAGSQVGVTVTAGGAGPFVANDVGKFIKWNASVAGTHPVCDRITGYTNANNVTVETSRTITSDTFGINTAKMLISSEGVLSGSGGVSFQALLDQPSGHITEWLNTSGTVLASVGTDGKATFPAVDVGVVHITSNQIVVGSTVAAAPATVDVFIKTGGNAEQALALRPVTSGQTANMFESQYSDGTVAWGLDKESRPIWSTFNVQTTVGAAGAASALPGAPAKYVKFFIGGTLYVFPAWLAA